MRAVHQSHPDLILTQHSVQSGMLVFGRYAKKTCMYTPEMLHKSIEKIHQFGKEAGRDLSNFRPGLFIFASVYPDRNQAREQAAWALGKNYAQDLSKIAGCYTLYGNRDACRKRLKE